MDKITRYHLYLTETHQKVVAKNAITVARNIFNLKSDKDCLHFGYCVGTLQILHCRYDTIF